MDKPKKSHQKQRKDDALKLAELIYDIYKEEKRRRRFSSGPKDRS